MPDCIVKPWNTRFYDEHWIEGCVTNKTAGTLEDAVRKNLFEDLLAKGQLDPNDGNPSSRFIHKNHRVEVKKTGTDYKVYVSKTTDASLSAKFLAYKENYGALSGFTDYLLVTFSLEGKTIKGEKQGTDYTGPSAKLMRHVKGIEEILRSENKKRPTSNSASLPNREQ